MMYRHEHYLSAIRLASEGLVQLKPLISRHFPLKEFQQAYQHIDAHRETTMKVLVDVTRITGKSIISLIAWHSAGVQHAVLSIFVL